MTTENIYSSPPKVAVIILNWNGKDDTLECLSSVNQLNYPNYDVIVVDNGSTDDSIEAISKQYPDIILLHTGKNLGYAGGNNIGMRWALEQEANYLLLLNNDTIVDPNLLSEFVQTAKNYKQGGLFGAKIFYYDEPDTLWNAGADWNPSTGDHRTRGAQSKDGEAFNTITESAYANGCALFASSEMLLNIGLLNEDFFLIYEETDLSYRAKKAGYKVYFAPEAKVWHKVSVSIGGDNSPIARYFTARNQLLWASRNLSWQNRLRVYRHVVKRLCHSFFPTLVLVKSEVALSHRLIWMFSSWFKQLKRNLLSPANRADLMGLRDYFMSRLGDCPESIRQMAKLEK
ncbi:MAG: glycosyltransferase family 2 protein [Methyloprofundus sp.]|nr:glycosyltransferase family 2 protein [Methyloprofundus sp.]